MSDLQKYFDIIKSYLNFYLFSIGNSQVTLWTLLYFIILTWLLFYLTSKIRKWFVYKLLANSKTDLGIRLAVGTIIRYVIISLGLIIVMDTVGINLSTLAILAGALGVGIGFGLQNITNNLVSGIIILFERPIKVGDRVEISGVKGDVINISIRSTTIVTNDNISVIVPNSEFISSTVINWSHNDRRVRFQIPVGVAYKEDPEKVREILLDVVNNEEGILKEPKPDVLFDQYADSSLNFILRVWTNAYITTPGILKSRLYFEIFKKFKENNIEIPFPQRDVHIKNTEFKVNSTDK